MRKYTIYIVLLLAGGLYAGCKKNEPQQYREKPAIYFSSFSDKDSLIHSLAGSTNPTDTVFVPVRLLGNKSEKDQTFSIRVDKAYTSAVEGQHYEKLKDGYTLPAGSFSTTVPIVLFKTDPELTKQYKRIGLTIEPSAELNTGYPARLNARILFTNELVMPVYWDAFLKLYYGEYSKVKHRKCIEVQGFNFPATRAEIPNSQIGTLMSYGRIVCKFYTDNIVNDENGNRIMPWAAF